MAPLSLNWPLASVDHIERKSLKIGNPAVLQGLGPATVTLSHLKLSLKDFHRGDLQCSGQDKKANWWIRHRLSSQIKSNKSKIPIANYWYHVLAYHLPPSAFRHFLSFVKLPRIGGRPRPLAPGLSSSCGECSSATALSNLRVAFNVSVL